MFQIASESELEARSQLQMMRNRPNQECQEFKQPSLTDEKRIISTPRTFVKWQFLLFYFAALGFGQPIGSFLQSDSRRSQDRRMCRGNFRFTPGGFVRLLIKSISPVPNTTGQPFCMCLVSMDFLRCFSHETVSPLPLVIRSPKQSRNDDINSLRLARNVLDRQTLCSYPCLHFASMVIEL